MQTVHGTIHDDAPAVPEPPVYIGMPVDIEEQRELFRQVEARRAAALHNARPAWRQDYAGIFGADHVGVAHQARERMREDEERMERIIRLRRQREAEEQERRLREQRLIREAEQRRREQEARQGGGWGCTIM